MADAGKGSGNEPPDAPSSSELLRRARRGDRPAIEGLFERMAPWLRRRAHGRLPAWARGVIDTNDLVQDALLNTFRRIAGFESHSSVAFRSYLLQAVDRRVQDEMRRVRRHGIRSSLEEEGLPPAGGPSPLNRLIDDETWSRYLRALARLGPRDRRLIVGRAELGYSFRQLALIDHRASPDAARIALRRALVRLAAEMER